MRVKGTAWRMRGSCVCVCVCVRRAGYGYSHINFTPWFLRVSLSGPCGNRATCPPPVLPPLAPIHPAAPFVLPLPPTEAPQSISNSPVSFVASTATAAVEGSSHDVSPVS